MSEKKDELPIGEQLAETQYRLHTTTLILRLRTKEDVMRCIDYLEAKKRLQEAVGREKAHQVETEIFEEEKVLFPKEDDSE